MILILISFLVLRRLRVEGLHLPFTNDFSRSEAQPFCLSPDTVRLLIIALIRYDDPASMLRSP